MNDVQSKLVFYGAISVDGYLAREDHSLDWLFGTEGEGDMGYADYIKDIDIVLMGRKTYEQIFILEPNEFPYTDKECYVFSRSLTGSDDYVEFINEDIIQFTKALKDQSGKRIWIVGGGEVLRPLLQAQLIDEFFIQFAPVIIGNGIPLFPPSEVENKLSLIGVKNCGQMAELHYKLKK